QQRVDRRGGGTVSHIHQLLDPDEFGRAVVVAQAAHVDGQVAPLVVGTVVADCFAAGAETRHRGANGQDEVVAIAVRLGHEGACVVHEGAGAAHGGNALQEVGE